jgi:hypothetical protein
VKISSFTFKTHICSIVKLAVVNRIMGLPRIDDKRGVVLIINIVRCTILFVVTDITEELGQ